MSRLLEKKEIVVADDQRARILFPDNLLQAIVDSEDADVVIVKGALSERRARALEMRLREILYTLAFKAKQDWLDQPPNQSEIDALVVSEGPILVESGVLGKTPKIPEGAEHNLPAMLVMFFR